MATVKRKPLTRAQMDAKNAKRRAAATRVVGRPTKYRPEYCDRVVAMAVDGCSFVELAVDLKVTRSTLYEWRDNHPDFSVALERAREVAMVWFAKTFRGTQGVTGPDGEWIAHNPNMTGVIFQAKNQFPAEYKDRREVTHDGDLKLVTIDFLGYEGDEDDA